MRNTKTRGLLASAGALATAVALALGGSAAAYAAPPQPAPETSDVVITKLKQQDPLGQPADGTQQSGFGPDDLINGVTFEAYLVPNTAEGETNDIGTNAGQQVAAQYTVATAQAAIGSASPDRTGTTGVAPNPSGQVVWDDLPRGLYLVKENLTNLPEGVTASAPFLLAVPLTDPTDNDAWLDTIYIYPKNSKVSGVKTVENADQLVVGGDVTWTIATDIPLVANPNFDASEAPSPTNPKFIAPDAYRIDDTLQNDELALSPAYSAGANSGIVVTAGGAALTEGNGPTPGPVTGDYYVLADTTVSTQTTYRIVFTPAGLAKLAAAVNADSTAQVEIELVTTVLAADEITNSANFYPNQNAITENNPVPVTPSEVKYGSTQVNKKSTDASAELAGAQFQVFASKDDAESLTNPLTPAAPNPADPNYDAVTGTWTTPASGEFVIEGLRFSNFADGEAQLPYLDVNGDQTSDPAERDSDNPKYQTYWLVEVVALDGHQLLAAPVPFTITNTDATATAFDVTNQHNTGGFVLPLTGGMGTALLTIGGIAILATVLLVARRRRSESAAAE